MSDTDDTPPDIPSAISVYTRINDLETALRAVCERWRQEYHCCDGLRPVFGKGERVAQHSADCVYVVACLLIGLAP